MKLAAFVRVGGVLGLALSSLTCSSDVAGPPTSRDEDRSAGRLISAQGEILYGSGHFGQLEELALPARKRSGGMLQLAKHGPSSLYTIDPATGVATLVGPIGFDTVGGMDFHPITGVLYAAAQRPGTDINVLIQIDPATGVGTEVGAMGISDFSPIADVSFRPDGTLFAYDPLGDDDDELYTVNLTTGAATLVGLTGLIESSGNGIAFGGAPVLYHSNQNNTHVLNQTTGTATVIAPVSYGCPSPGGRLTAADQHPTTDVYYGIRICVSEGPETLVTINYLTGVATVVAPISPSNTGMETIAWGPAAPPPEPECSDGIDNDGDGLIDFPADPGCTSAADTAEFNEPQCSDAIDNDGDGLVDSADPGCASEGDNTESPDPPPPPPVGNCPAPPGGNVLTGRSFLGVVVFVGTEGDDVAVGIPGRRNIFIMRGGDDHANGADLQDGFHGGEGDDTWCGDGGSDAAFGGPGSDNLTGLDGFDRNDGGHTPVPSSSIDQNTDVCFGEANFLCEQSFPDGVVFSSIRFKQDVTYLLPEGRSLFGLRPVTFRYRAPYDDRAPGVQMGLIAEEVAHIYPTVVVYEAGGGARGIRYDILASRLVDRINQMAAEKLRERVARLAAMTE